MKIKLIIIIGAAVISLSYGYYYYYVDTLTLSEITGDTGNPFTNLAVGFFDFDTGLTRYDISQIDARKYYWLKRMKYVNNIRDPKQKEKETVELLNEMMDDPSMKKLSKLLFDKGLGFGIDILNYLN
jgi:hypothetical protein